KKTGHLIFLCTFASSFIAASEPLDAGRLERFPEAVLHLRACARPLETQNQNQILLVAMARISNSPGISKSPEH
ncbi:MAG: hypothetical protein Q4P24_17890, partial [Rhodobacterales bacterium]|nr:hypothetical protein [Rhodobacterales bacterium]